MTEEDLRSDGNEESTPTGESESEGVSEDFASIFDESSNDSKGDNSQEVIRNLQDKIARLEKGVNKLATDKGREAKSGHREEVGASVIKSLYFKANPDAEGIWDEVELSAKQLNKDPFDLYEKSAYLKGEAKSRAEAKKVEEENKAKVSKPSNKVAFSQDIASVKPEDVGKLTPAQKVEWIEAMAKREKANID